MMRETRLPTWLLFIAGCAMLAGCAREGRGPAPHDAIPLRDDGNAVLLLLDARLAAAGQIGHDLEWTNILRDRFGPFDVADLATVGEAGGDLLSERRLVVIPRRSLAAVDTSLAHSFDQLIRTGTTVLVEMPADLWGERFGLRFNGIDKRNQLPWPRPPREAREANPFLPTPAPLQLEYEAASYWPFRGPLGSPRILETPTGRAMHWKFPLGRGEWIALGFDFGAMLSALRQGRPGPDHRLSDRYPPEGLQSADLAAAPQLLRAERMWLDRWLHRILLDDGAFTPWPRLGSVPMQSDGWLVVGPAIEDDALRWKAGADEPFVAMSERGVRLDRSLGPATGPGGYVFGATPFHPLNGAGRLHDLWELPFQLRLTSDLSSLDPVRVWLNRNQGGAGSVVHVALPSGWERMPDALSQLAQQSSHRLASPEEYLHFWERRSRASLRWEFDGDELVVQWEIPPDEAELEAPPLLIPIRWQDRSLAKWSVDGVVPSSRRRDVYGRPHLIIESPREPATLRAIFLPASR